MPINALNEFNSGDTQDRIQIQSSITPWVGIF